MSSLNLHHLRTFCSVAASGGIRSAAEELLRAPSAVVRAVAALEADLDVTLFERKGRGMLLTGAGEMVLLRALRIAGELNAVREDAIRLCEQGTRVGAVDALFSTSRLLCASLLAQTHHMPSVARGLGLSQPAVSAAIAVLEKALCLPLFLRSARGMVPTDTGTRWIMRFDRALAEMSHIVADISALQGTLKGVVTIGALPLARTSILPTAIVNLLARHPELQVRSLESPYEELCGDLLSGKVDFILGGLRPATDKQLLTEFLFDEATVLIVRSGHPLTKQKHLGFKDIQKFPWVLSRAGTPLRDELETFFIASGQMPPTPAVETGDLALLRGLLVNSDMLTALTAHQLQYEIEAGILTALPFAMQGIVRGIGITTRAAAHFSPGAVALLDEVRLLSSFHVGKLMPEI